MEKLKIAVISGTTRKGNMTQHAAKLVADVGGEFEDVEVTLVNPADFELPFDGNDDISKDPKYTKLVAEADGFFIVFPEYNHGYPGSLKRLLDSELKNYVHKPVALGGVSTGPWGGTRGIEAIVPTVRELGMTVTFTDMNFPRIRDIFDEDGTLKDEQYKEFAKGAWEELIWMAKVMKAGRDSVPSKHHQ